MSAGLDLRTLAFVTVFVYMVLALIMASVWFIHKHEKSVIFWSASSVTGALGMILVGLRGSIPPYLSLTIGNVLAVSAFFIMWLGNCAYTSDKIGKKVIFTGIAAILACWIAIAAVQDNNTLRIGIASAFVALGCFLCGGALIYRAPKELYIVQIPASLIILFWGLVAVHRSLIASRLIEETFSPSFFQAAGFIVTILMPICYTAAQVLMISYRLHLNLNRLATTDVLTGVANRRAFLERAEAARALAKRTMEPLSLLIMDIDHFKKLNDTHGHAAGDEALKVFARVAGTVLRETDILGRIGGEEFAAILPATDLQSATIVANRLREAVAAVVVPGQKGAVGFTVSVGAAMINQNETIEAGLARADDGLYAAKKSGRNRVVVAA